MLTAVWLLVSLVKTGNESIRIGVASPVRTGNALTRTGNALTRTGVASPVRTGNELIKTGDVNQARTGDPSSVLYLFLVSN